MALTMSKFLLYALSLALLSHGRQEVLGFVATTRDYSEPMRTCGQIAAAISRASQVFFPRERVILSFCFAIYSNLIGEQAKPEYFLDLSHASASSSEASVCSVEPGTAEDVGKIVS